MIQLKPREGKLTHRVDGYAGGRRVQKKFESETAAKRFAKRLDLENNQWKEIALTPKDQIFTKELNQSLKDTGKTHADILAYVKRFAKIKSVRFSEFAERLQVELNRNPRDLDFPKYSQVTKYRLIAILKMLNDRFGQQYVADIVQDDIVEWLKSLRKVDGSRMRTSTVMSIRGHSFSIFKVAVLWKYTDVSPMRGMIKFEKTKEEKKEDYQKSFTRVLSSNVLERLLHAAEKSDPLLIPFITIPAFTGLRPEAVKQLDWSDIQLANKTLYIPDYKDKLDQPYPVPLPENLIEWLKPFEKASGPIVGHSYGPRHYGQPSPSGSRARLRYLARSIGIELPKNTFRHSSISMDIKRWGSIGETATKANNSPEIIRKFYLGRVKNMEDAVKYFEIRPHVDLVKRLRQSVVPPQYLHSLPVHDESGKWVSSNSNGVRPQPPPYRGNGTTDDHEAGVDLRVVYNPRTGEVKYVKLQSNGTFGEAFSIGRIKKGLSWEDGDYAARKLIEDTDKVPDSVYAEFENCNQWDFQIIGTNGRNGAQ